MPYDMRKIRNQSAYKVFNKISGVLHSKHTTLDKAKSQVRLLSAMDKKGKGLEDILYSDRKLDRMSVTQLLRLKETTTDAELLSRIRLRLDGIVNSPTQTGQLIRELDMEQIRLPATSGGSRQSQEASFIRSPPYSTSTSSTPLPTPTNIFAQNITYPTRTRAPPQTLILRKRGSDEDGDSKKSPAKKPKKGTGIKKGGAVRPPPPPLYEAPAVPPPPPGQETATFLAPNGLRIIVTGQHNIDLLRRNPAYRIITNGGSLVSTLAGLGGAGVFFFLFYAYDRLRNNEVVPEDIVNELMTRANIPIGSVAPLVNDIEANMEELPQAIQVEIRQAQRAVRTAVRPNIPEARARVTEGRGLPVGQIQQFLKNSYETPLAKNIGDFMIDNKLSGRRVQVYKNNTTPQAVVIHRGTQGLQDVITDYTYVRGLSVPTNSARFKHAEKIQKEAETKYGAENITTIGHSLGGLVASTVGKDSKEIINFNKAVSPVDAFFKTSDKEINIRSSRDPVSSLLPVRNSERTITIPSETYNPITEHTLDVLSRLDKNRIIGRGGGSSKIVPIDTRETDTREYEEMMREESEREERERRIAEIERIAAGIKNQLNELLGSNDIAKIRRVLNMSPPEERLGQTIINLENLVLQRPYLNTRMIRETIAIGNQLMDIAVGNPFDSYFSNAVPETEIEEEPETEGKGIRPLKKVVLKKAIMKKVVKREPEDMETKQGYGINDVVNFTEESRRLCLDFLETIDITPFYQRIIALGGDNINANKLLYILESFYRIVGSGRYKRYIKDLFRAAIYHFAILLDSRNNTKQNIDAINNFGSDSGSSDRQNDIELVSQLMITERRGNEDRWREANYDVILQVIKDILINPTNFTIPTPTTVIKTPRSQSHTTAIPTRVQPITEAREQRTLPEASAFPIETDIVGNYDGVGNLIGYNEVLPEQYAGDPRIRYNPPGFFNLTSGEGLAKKISPPIKKMAKKPNPWVVHIKQFAAKKGISYTEALKHPDISKGYKKGGMIEEDEKQGKGSCMKGTHHMEGMGMSRINKPVAIRGRGMPTTLEANIAERYNESQLGANGGRGYFSL